MALPATVKSKKQGDIIRSEDWNIVTNEVDRLDVAKANLTGDTIFTGPLSVQLDSVGVVNSGHVRLIETQKNDYARLSFSNANIPNQSWHIAGLASLDKGGSRLNFWESSKGDVMSLFSDGRVEILQGNLSFGNRLAQQLSLWGTTHGMGVQNGTTYFRTGNQYSWFLNGAHNDAMGNPGTGGSRLMALNGAGDLILCARSNPTNDPDKSMCRALVNTTGPDALHINFGNDFAGGTFIDSALTVISGRLDVGTKSFIFRRFENLGDNTLRTTGMPANTWNAGIVGFKAVGGDIQESGQVNPITMGMYIASGIWHIRADFATHNAPETWYVDVLFVHVGMSARDGGNWNTY